MNEKILNEGKKYISNPDYIFDLYDLTFVYANEEAEKKLGLPSGYFLGKTVFDVFGYDDKEELQKAIVLELDDAEVDFALNITKSPISKIRVKFKNFKLDDTPYRVGTITQYTPKEQ